MVIHSRNLVTRTMKTYSQFTEFLSERVQWQSYCLDHLFYDADKLL